MSHHCPLTLAMRPCTYHCPLTPRHATMLPPLPPRPLPLPQVYQDLCVKHPTFRERSERVDLSVSGVRSEATGVQSQGRRPKGGLSSRAGGTDNQ